MYWLKNIFQIYFWTKVWPVSPRLRPPLQRRLLLRCVPCRRLAFSRALGSLPRSLARARRCKRFWAVPRRRRTLLPHVGSARAIKRRGGRALCPSTPIAWTAGCSTRAETPWPPSPHIFDCLILMFNCILCLMFIFSFKFDVSIYLF